MRSDAERPAAPVTMTRRPRDDAETRSWASPENVNVNPVPLAATDPRWTTEQDRELVKAVLECEYDFGEVARRISAKHLEAMTEGEVFNGLERPKAGKRSCLQELASVYVSPGTIDSGKKHGTRPT